MLGNAAPLLLAVGAGPSLLGFAARQGVGAVPVAEGHSSASRNGSSNSAGASLTRRTACITRTRKRRCTGAHVPTLELTQNYIWALDKQLSTSFISQLCASENAVKDEREQDYVEWVDQVQDSNPAFSNFEPGKRGGHVSYGGV
jgi:hypothetical protein